VSVARSPPRFISSVTRARLPTMSTLPAPGSWRAWVLASRPATLWAAFVPVLVGAACATQAGGLRWGPSLLALACAFLIQIGTNFANDLFDFEKGADTSARLGPTRAVQAGLLSRHAMRWATILTFIMAFLSGLGLTWFAGWPFVVIGIASILSGIAYTAGPFPLGYHGLGDLFVFVFFGLVAVAGTAYANLGFVPALAWWTAVPVGCLTTAILVVNNVRDRATDEQAGKRTLAVRWGRRAGVWEYRLLLITAYLVPLLLAVQTPAPWLVLPLLTLPLAWRLNRELTEQDGAALNPVLASTAKLLLLFGGLLAIGIVVG
jgi:1,4-dihydroxy-2-naphthoate polyprenyltransferase